MADTQNILVVEDEKPMNKALSLKLEKDGFAVQQAFNGNEALELMEKNSFDMVLMDLVMPVMDGLTLLEELKQRKITTPVIVLSNLSQEEDEQRARELGAKDFFVKSNTPLVEIIDYIKRHI